MWFINTTFSMMMYVNIINTWFVYTLCRIQHSLQVATFNVEPAFLSSSNDLQSYLRQIEEKGDAGTPPGKNHPILVTPLDNILLPNRLSNRGDHEVVMLSRPKQELIGGDECWTVYRMESLLPHSVVYRESGFLSTDVLKSYGVDDMTALYCSKVATYKFSVLGIIL